MRNYVLLVGLFAVSCSSEDEQTLPPPTGSSLAGVGSFSGDVVPIVRNSCALTACHASKTSNLGIHLTHDASQIFAELQKESPSYPGVKFVVAGNPEQSFLYLKMEGRQASLGAKCTGTKPCGSEMPPDELVPQAERDLVEKWIQNGAKND